MRFAGGSFEIKFFKTLQGGGNTSSEGNTPNWHVKIINYCPRTPNRTKQKWYSLNLYLYLSFLRGWTTTTTIYQSPPPHNQLLLFPLNSSLYSYSLPPSSSPSLWISDLLSWEQRVLKRISKLLQLFRFSIRLLFCFYLSATTKRFEVKTLKIQ